MHARADADCPFYKFVWINHTPPRVRFFAWLLVQGKIQCKTNLLLKNIVDDAECELCHMDVESPDHLILHCPTATQFWTVLGITIPPYCFGLLYVGAATARSHPGAFLPHLPVVVCLAAVEAPTLCRLQKHGTIPPPTDARL